MWHVSSRSGVATLRTAIHLLLIYLLTLQHAATVTVASGRSAAATEIDPPYSPGGIDTHPHRIHS